MIKKIEMDTIKLELLKANYLEHFKYAKDLALILPITHPQRTLIERELNKIQKEMEQLKN